MKAKVEIPKDEIEAFSRCHRIRKLSLVGSVLRDDFTASGNTLWYLRR